MGWLRNEAGLERCAANFVPLTPLSHLARAKLVYPEQEAIVHQSLRYTYAEYWQRVTCLAGALAECGISPGDVVSTILPNVPAAVETHFAVPACGAVLNAINIRLDVPTVAYIFSHAESKLAFVDTQFLSLAEAAAKEMPNPPQIIEVADPESGYPATGNYREYASMIADGPADFGWAMPKDEWESISLNYTSGTTGKPKGVVCSHRGAYLMTMGTVVSWRMTLYPRYLAIVPLFHCNGWNHTWLMPAMGGTVICCRNVTAKAIYDAVADERVTHFGGAPIVLGLLANAPPGDRREIGHRVEVFTAGAPPAASTLKAVEKLGFNITQTYGLTETYGHVVECVWKDALWGGLSEDRRAEIKAHQGVLIPTMEEITVVGTESGTEVQANGKDLGEVVMRGNSVMKGYYRNPQATLDSFRGGSFRSGDIAVLTPDRYIRIADRSKDIIISGGENVSSVEIEGVLMSHPDVSLCAVVAKPDQVWGEVPHAFVELQQGADASESDLIAFCRKTLAGFKAPKGVTFTELPKTATGKIQKFELRKSFQPS